MNTKQAASLLNVTVATICNYIRDGKIKAHIIEKKNEWLIDDQSFENFSKMKKTNGI